MLDTRTRIDTFGPDNGKAVFHGVKIRGFQLPITNWGSRVFSTCFLVIQKEYEKLMVKRQSALILIFL
jgi:hypothetical protein